ncbi:hypothetical protein LIER_31388 [Lithospermum erythrorhizon]|uniref:Kinesin motor domain-containing protein n=1 Tax=Lithospermum erythrorhizon TaxID=34254 RepID=A0AAV3RUD4_LITER
MIKILVTVRVRPLSTSEQAAYDLIAWEIDEHTIVSMIGLPNHTDRVSDQTSTTRNVYNEGARDVLLSALCGINTIMLIVGVAISGKTYNQRHCENAIQNIYHHIQIVTSTREFALKFSALEIYNETVVQLLNREPGPLRITFLLPLKDKCDKSSRSHQIIKLMEMEREMNELKRQRDIAQSQLEQEISQPSNQDGPSRQVIKCLSFEDNGSLSSTPLSRTRARKGLTRIVLPSIPSADPSIIVHEIRKLEMWQRQLGDEANRALELLHKEVVSYKLGSQGSAETVANLLSEIKGMHTITSAPEEFDLKDKASLREEIERLNSHESNITTLEQKLENVQRTIERLSTHLPSHEGAPEFQPITLCCSGKNRGGGIFGVVGGCGECRRRVMYQPIYISITCSVCLIFIILMFDEFVPCSVKALKYQIECRGKGTTLSKMGH